MKTIVVDSEYLKEMVSKKRIKIPATIVIDDVAGKQTTKEQIDKILATKIPKQPGTRTEIYKLRRKYGWTEIENTFNKDNKIVTQRVSTPYRENGLLDILKK